MSKRLLTVLGGGVNYQNTGFTMTCTTTGAVTLTITALTVAIGKTVTVDWGDGSSDTYSAGAGARTHDYAGAGTWTVKITPRINITLLDIRDQKVTSLIISKTNPLPSELTSLNLSGLSGLSYNVNEHNLPSSLTYLVLNSLPGLIYNVNNAPLPSGITFLTLATLTNLTYNVNNNSLPSELTSLYLQAVSGLTWEINAVSPWPTGATTMTVLDCPGVTCTAWTNNAIRTIRLENAYTRTQIDNFLQLIWANKANFTYATLSLDLFGGLNSSPGGIYQLGSGAAGLPITGKEYAYDLVNGVYTSAGAEWTVVYCESVLGYLGDSITSITTGYHVAVGTGYKSGRTEKKNHAVGGATILANMDSQILAAVSDDNDIIIIALGTNDDNAGNMTTLQAEYEENIAELKASNPRATIYAMNVLPCWTDNGGGTPVDKSNIRTAIAAACTAQSITCWDTFTTPWIDAADTIDGLHPTTTATIGGHAKIAAKILTLLP